MQPLLVSTLLGTMAVVIWRIREGTTPVSVPKIVAPPLGMSTGLCMFLYPPTRISLELGVAAFLVGLVFLAQPLIATTRLERRPEGIFLQRSTLFMKIFLVLVALRFLLRGYLTHWISPLQTAALMYLLALGMILRWRWAMFRDYRRLRDSQDVPETEASR